MIADNPSLTVRLPETESHQAVVPPLRVVLDSRLSSLHYAAIRSDKAPTLYIHAPNTPPPTDLQFDHVALPLCEEGRLDLKAVLAHLAVLEINEIQVEAGATLAGALLREKLVDELLLYLAPVVLGDTARPLFSELPITHMAQRLQLKLIDSLHLGGDIRLRFRPLTT